MPTPVVTHAAQPDPDRFADELQDCLHCHGPRSREVRALLRQARKLKDPELERIFETKLAEFQRFHRETRVPTWLNLPVRLFESLWDDVRYRPPRDAVQTLAYVAVVLLGVEAAKRYALPHWGRSNAESVQSLASLDLDALEGRWTTLPSTEKETLTAVDQWLLSEFERAAANPEVQAALTQRLASAIDQIVASPEFQSRLQSRLEERADNADVAAVASPTGDSIAASPAVTDATQDPAEPSSSKQQ